MFYLGQALKHRKYKSDPFEPAILSGYSEGYAPIITLITEKGELIKHKNTYVGDIFPIRRVDKKAPTGTAIYNGPLLKKGLIAPVKLKLPEEAELISILKEIHEKIKEEK